MQMDGELSGGSECLCLAAAAVQLSGKPKIYSFFLLEDGLAAANSSGTGGKTLMYRA